jgi:hypothetical protein
MASGSDGGEALEDGSAEVAPGGTDDGSVIKVIVAYTADFVSEAGGAGNVAAYMDAMEQETNLSFSLSGVNTSVDIVHSYQTAYGESTNFRKDADYFMNGLGAGQQLRSLRNSNMADIMVVMTGNMGYDSCGYSAGFNVQGHEENPNGHNALAIVREGCGTGYYGFAHQLGFIFGADLNNGNSNMVGGGEDYAHGYCDKEELEDQEGKYRTIMSYNCPGISGGKRLPLWSNPNKTFNGNAMGVAGVSNNVKVLNDRALEVSNFRFPVALPDQVTLISPLGVIINDTTPTFTWQPAAGATEYILDVSGTLVTVSATAAHCGSGTCSTTPTTELPYTSATWKVTSSNATGNGPVSDTGLFTVSQIPQVPDPVVSIGPMGLITDTTPTYSWNAVGNADEYRLYVRPTNGDWRDSIIFEVYSAADAECQSGSGVCQVTPSIALPAGTEVTWWVQSINAVGATWNWAGRKTVTLLP